MTGSKTTSVKATTASNKPATTAPSSAAANPVKTVSTTPSVAPAPVATSASIAAAPSAATPSVAHAAAATKTPNVRMSVRADRSDANVDGSSLDYMSAVRTHQSSAHLGAQYSDSRSSVQSDYRSPVPMTSRSDARGDAIGDAVFDKSLPMYPVIQSSQLPDYGEFNNDSDVDRIFSDELHQHHSRSPRVPSANTPQTYYTERGVLSAPVLKCPSQNHTMGHIQMQSFDPSPDHSRGRPREHSQERSRGRSREHSHGRPQERSHGRHREHSQERSRESSRDQYASSRVLPRDSPDFLHHDPTGSSFHESPRGPTVGSHRESPRKAPDAPRRSVGSKPTLPDRPTPKRLEFDDLTVAQQGDLTPDRLMNAAEMHLRMAYQEGHVVPFGSGNKLHEACMNTVAENHCVTAAMIFSMMKGGKFIRDDGSGVGNGQ